MFDKLILWCIKQLVRLWDRHDDAMAYSFSGGENKDYSIIVECFYDDYYTIGTQMFPVNKPPKDDHCADCVHYPPSSGDGKPCCACDPANPLTNCHEAKEETE